MTLQFLGKDPESEYQPMTAQTATGHITQDASPPHE